MHNSFHIFRQGLVGVAFLVILPLGSHVTDRGPLRFGDVDVPAKGEREVTAP